ncbi:MAG: prephenate dehydratase [Lachnospiraceae bacterium]|nr:prephenate dehydratase [Lachnospiraceae bacterium]
MAENQSELLQYRDQLDEIDQKIVDLYKQRMSVCEKVADYKIKSGKKIFDKQREEEKIRTLSRLAEDDFNRHGIGELFEQIMCTSRKLQYKRLEEAGFSGNPPFIGVKDLSKGPVRVVYQGAQGSYSEAATKAFFSEEANVFCVETFRDAMGAIEEGSAEYAVLPIENSTAGTVSEIYDLLAEFENYIVGEQIMPIEHCLLGLPGADLGSIKRVYAHPQALMQSERFLESYGYEQIGMKNNAFAAAKVKQDGDPEKAAVASEYAAGVYGLEILKKGINQSDTNSTRFIIVTNRKIYKEDAEKISICFELPHRSGSLYRMLSHFIYNDLNMTRIESRPIPDRDWEYRFFLDFEGNLAQGAVRNALRGLREEARYLRVLGNY